MPLERNDGTQHCLGTIVSRVKRSCLIGGNRFWLGKDVRNSRGWRRRRGEAQLSRGRRGKDRRGRRGRRGKVPIRKGEDGWFSLC
jgi:hypothetical protein